MMKMVMRMMDVVMLWIFIGSVMPTQTGTLPGIT